MTPPAAGGGRKEEREMRKTLLALVCFAALNRGAALVHHGQLRV